MAMQGAREDAMDRDLEELFYMVDEDHGGTIEAAEFGSALQRVGIKLEPAGLKSLFAEIDVNKNASIDLDEWKVMMRGLERKMRRRGTQEEVCRAVKCILQVEKDFRWQQLLPGFTNIGLDIDDKLPKGKQPLHMFEPIRDVVNSQRRERRSLGENISDLPVGGGLGGVDINELGGALHQLLCKTRADRRCDLDPTPKPRSCSDCKAEYTSSTNIPFEQLPATWVCPSPGCGATKNKYPDTRIMDLWRQAVRRFLWLDLLHETIEENHTMHGQQKSGLRTEGDIRIEIEAKTFFFSPDHILVTRWWA